MKQYNLWKDKSRKPKLPIKFNSIGLSTQCEESVEIVFITIRGTINHIDFTSWTDWKEMIKVFGIVKWCYVFELLYGKVLIEKSK